MHCNKTKIKTIKKYTNTIRDMNMNDLVRYHCEMYDNEKIVKFVVLSDKNTISLTLIVWDVQKESTKVPLLQISGEMSLLYLGATLCFLVSKTSCSEGNNEFFKPKRQVSVYP